MKIGCGCTAAPMIGFGLRILSGGWCGCGRWKVHDKRSGGDDDGVKSKDRRSSGSC